MSETPEVTSCAKYGSHVWKKDGAEPIQAGAPCVCGEEVWDADEDEWPPDGLTPEESVWLLFKTFADSNREK